jgi:hypothetical protein
MTSPSPLKSEASSKSTGVSILSIFQAENGQNNPFILHRHQPTTTYESSNYISVRPTFDSEAPWNEVSSYPSALSSQRHHECAVVTYNGHLKSRSQAAGKDSIGAAVPHETRG